MNDLIMQNIDVGWVVESFGSQFRVEKILRNPLYDKDGVPCHVTVRGIKDSVHVSISFGGPPGTKIEDWRNWKVISKPS